MDYDTDTNQHDMDTRTQSTPGHTLAQRDLNTQAPRNTKRTSNPETKQNPHLTTTLQTRDADGPRVGAEHITRLGVRPFVKTLALSKPKNTSPTPPQNTKPTNPEIEQTPNLTTTIQTWDAAGPRVGAEHTNGLGVRPL